MEEDETKWLRDEEPQKQQSSYFPEPFFERTSFSQKPASKKTSKRIILFFLTFLILTAFGTISLLYFRIWDPAWNPFNLLPTQVMMKFFTNIDQMKTFHSESRISVVVTIDYGRNIEPMVTTYDVYASSNTDGRDQNNKKSEAALKAEAKMSGMSFSLEGEGKVIGKDLYYKIDEFPLFSLMTYLSSDEQSLLAKGKWIKISPGDFDSFDYISIGIQGEKIQKKIDEKMKELQKNANFYVFKKELPSEKINGKSAYHYSFSVNNEEVIKAIIDFLKVFNEEDSDYNIFSSQIDTNISLLRSYLRYLADNSVAYYPQKRLYDIDFTRVNCSGHYCDSIKEITGEFPVINATKSKYCSYVKSEIEGYYLCTVAEDPGKLPTLNSYPTIDIYVTNIFPGGNGYCTETTFTCPQAKEIPDAEKEKLGEKMFKTQLDDFFAKLGEIEGEVWIGKSDKFLHKIKVSKETDLNKFIPVEEFSYYNNPPSETKLTVSWETTFSNINESINIQAPADAKSLTEILKVPQNTSQDAATKSRIEMLRVSAELYWDEYSTNNSKNNYNGSYKGFCSSDDVKKVTSLIEESVACYDSEAAYCVESTLRSGGQWCVDSTGYAGSSAQCSATNLSCRTSVQGGKPTTALPLENFMASISGIIRTLLGGNR